MPAAGQCVYTFTPGQGWSVVNYGCGGVNPCPPCKPTAWTKPTDPTAYTQLVTDCSGHGSPPANVAIVVDPTQMEIDITLANGWTARIKEPNDCSQSEMLTTVVGPTGIISNGENTV